MLLTFKTYFWGWGCTSVTECALNVYKTLESIPSDNSVKRQYARLIFFILKFHNKILLFISKVMLFVKKEVFNLYTKWSLHSSATMINVFSNVYFPRVSEINAKRIKRKAFRKQISPVVGHEPLEVKRPVNSDASSRGLMPSSDLLGHQAQTWCIYTITLWQNTHTHKIQ